MGCILVRVNSPLQTAQSRIRRGSRLDCRLDWMGNGYSRTLPRATTKPVVKEEVNDSDSQLQVSMRNLVHHYYACAVLSTTLIYL